MITGALGATDRLTAVPETHVTAGHHRPAGSGGSRLASAAAPVSAPRERARPPPTPRGANGPRHSPAEALVLVVIPA